MMVERAKVVVGVGIGSDVDRDMALYVFMYEG